MPTNLGEPTTIDWRGTPPHMLREDIPVWSIFMDKYGSLFLRVYYDTLVGGPWLTPEEEKDRLKWMWRYNNSKRPDIIAERETEVWIIEVATRPGLRAIGQLLTYSALWLEDPKINKLEKMVLVAQAIDTDLISAASKYGISTYIITL